MDVSRLSDAFGPPEGATFIALLSRRAYCILELHGGLGYEQVKVVTADEDEIPLTLASLEGPHHVFCVTTDAPFRSPPQATLGETKLGVLPLFSTGFSVPKLERALEIIARLDYQAQYLRSKQVLDRLADAESILFESTVFGTSARLGLDSARPIHLFNQSGPIQWGRQSVLPNGEVSLLTDGHGRYSASSRFALDGEIALFGYPILHRGSCPCAVTRMAHTCDLLDSAAPVCEPSPELYVSAELQEQVFRNLVDIERCAVIVRVAGGVIEDIQSTGNESRFAVQLHRLIESDDNYRKIHEIGFGLNPCDGFFLSENFLPNEMRLGVHFGLGLTPYTQFHLDIACSAVSALSDMGDEQVQLF